MLLNRDCTVICHFFLQPFNQSHLYWKKLQSCHEEEKPFECLECGKKFAKAILLRDHRKRHFEKGGYECSYCPKTFFTPIKLREHVRVHTGETPLSCNICGKGFKRHSNLSEHKRIHDANRPVKPPKELFCHCGKMFTTKRELDWHTEEVHERVPKKCGKLKMFFFFNEKFPKISRIPKNFPFFFENIQFPTSHF